MDEHFDTLVAAVEDAILESIRAGKRASDARDDAAKTASEASQAYAALANAEQAVLAYIKEHAMDGLQPAPRATAAN